MRGQVCNGQMWKLALQATVARISSWLPFSTPPSRPGRDSLTQHRDSITQHRNSITHPSVSHHSQVHHQAASLETRVQPWGSSAGTLPQGTSGCRQETWGHTRETLAGTRESLGDRQPHVELELEPTTGTRRQRLRDALGQPRREVQGQEQEQPTQGQGQEQPMRGATTQAPQLTLRQHQQEVEVQPTWVVHTQDGAQPQRARGGIAQVAPWPRHP
jgi:hypothetical protein